MDKNDLKMKMIDLMSSNFNVNQMVSSVRRHEIDEISKNYNELIKSFV